MASDAAIAPPPNQRQRAPRKSQNLLVHDVFPWVIVAVTALRRTGRLGTRRCRDDPAIVPTVRVVADADEVAEIRIGERPCAPAPAR